MGKSTITILGGSHAYLMFDSLQADPSVCKKYNLLTFAKTGCTFKVFQDTLPIKFLEKLTSTDLVIIQTFGNDIFEPKTHAITRHPRKLIHLLSFKPTGEEYISQLCEKLWQLLSNVKARIILVGHIYRGFCCSEHQYPDNFPYQERITRLIESFFKDKCTVINYLDLLDGNESTEIRIRDYSADGTHLKKEWYNKITRKIMIEFGKE